MSVRRDPFEAMERMFEQMRRAGFRADPLGAGHGDPGFDANVSVERIDEDVVVLADLPGFERDEIELTYADRTLTIEATNEEGDGEAYRSRSVRETVAVPEDVDPETVAATYRNGVLEVRLPVDESGDDGHRIDIE